MNISWNDSEGNENQVEIEPLDIENKYIKAKMKSLIEDPDMTREILAFLVAMLQMEKEKIIETLATKVGLE